MRESDFWSQHCRAPLNKGMVSDRIENVAGSGMPDVSYSINDVTGWLELKVEKAGLLYFQRSQLPWMIRRLRHCSRVFVLAYGTTGIVRLIHAPEVLRAEQAMVKKWVTVRWKDLTPVVELRAKPWRWENVRKVLNSGVQGGAPAVG